MPAHTLAKQIYYPTRTSFDHEVDVGVQLEIYPTAE